MKTMSASWPMHLAWRLICVSLLVGVTGIVNDENALAFDELDIQLRNGSSLTVEVESQIVSWTNVHDDGQMTTERIDLGNIERLWITNEPASQQVATVRKLLSQLNSPIYREREAAEQQLSDVDIGGPYRNLIELQQNHKVFEVRYRVTRILDALEQIRSKAAKPTKFDRMLLKSGKVLDGDIGDFTLKFKYANRTAELGREHLQALGAVKRAILPKKEPEHVAVQLIHEYEGEFYLPQQTTINFEVDTDGEEMKKNFDVSDAFTKLGVRFATEAQGFVGISGYEFRFAPEKPAEGNSVCVFETSNSFPKRFKGVLELRFCVPGQPHVPAGVNECGLILARVNHNRDFLMEAYSADGHLLASVEAVDDQCVFLGVKSNELIAFIRVLSNPYLHRVSRKVDEDYAVDDVCFSTPQPLAIGNSNDANQIRLRNGDRLVAANLKFTNNERVQLEGASIDTPFEFALSDVKEIRLANDLTNTSNDWLAMLADRSVIRIETGKNNASVSFSGEVVDQDQIVGMTMTQNGFRFPTAGDFDSGQNVLVFPTCRIAGTSVEFQDESLVWDENATKIIQPIYTSSAADEDDDPTPQTNQIDLGEGIPSDIPTIWFSIPKSRSPATGLIQLVDGQQFVLGSQQQFEISNIATKGLTISWRGKTFDVPWIKVRTIQFPAGD